ncbi:hypothetical protein [Candidatus Poriferisodalis sp.]|uniref:hypothetical protein n=1 Tax=Candidatus Poriferisodalis sp. TaxID=3101277 RepID=UPI003B0292D6
MTDETDVQTVPAEKTRRDKKDPTTQHKHSYGGLSVLGTTQRLLAAIDLTRFSTTDALHAATTDHLQRLAEAHEVITKGIAQSIDFSNIGSAYEAGANALGLQSAVDAQQQWADSLDKAINISALGNAIDSSSLLMATSAAGQELAEAFKHQFDGIRRISESITFKLPEIDFGRWAQEIDNWIPRNLRAIKDLEAVAVIALSEGIPLSWVPRAEIVAALLAADTPTARLSALIEHQDNILDDCEAALERVADEIALQCRSAIDALRRGFHGPAQSHASNILDSLIRASFRSKGHLQAIELSQKDFMDRPLGVAAENLTLRPVFRAYSTWFPSTGTPIPSHFSRNVTSHGLGHVGVITPSFALIAVMLATSLAVQYMPAEIDPKQSVAVDA